MSPQNLRRLAVKFGPWRPDPSRVHHTRLYRLAHGFFFFHQLSEVQLRDPVTRRKMVRDPILYSPPCRIPIRKLVWYPCGGNRMAAPSDQLSVKYDNLDPAELHPYATAGMPLL